MSEALKRYADLFSRLSLDNLSELRALLADDVAFKDPFSEIKGADAMTGLMRQMFEDTKNPRFTIERALPDGMCGLIQWRFTCQVRLFGELDFRGTSEVEFNGDGLLIRHVDYWDSGEHIYARLPLLGWCVNFIRRRLAYKG